MSTFIYIVHTTEYIILGVYPTFESAEAAIETLWDRSIDSKYLAIVRNEMGKDLVFFNGLDELGYEDELESDPDEGVWVYTRKISYKTIRL